MKLTYIWPKKGYNLTFQKRVSGFKLIGPAAKVIRVEIVLIVMMTFMNVH